MFGRTAIGNFLPDLVYQAIAPAAPTRICGGSGATPMWGQYMFGKRRDGADFAPFNVASGGLGARAGKDGVSCLAFPYNVGNTPVEIIESEVPMIVEERSLWQDSAGPGKYRGGFGQKYVLRMLDGELGPMGDVLASFRGGRFVHPPEGVLGGGAAPNGFLSIAGYGDAKERDLAAVARDLKNGLISAEHAKAHYGYEAA